MKLRFYNTLSKKIEDFSPIDDGVVRLYTCGPTVYDYAHIGNWRSFIFDDTLRRTLEISGYEVRHVMNVTDVGHLTDDADEGKDKLEAGAAREGKSVWDVAKHYTKTFIHDAKLLNILAPNAYEGPDGPYAKATDFIEQQIEIVKILLDKGLAYKTEQAIYFDVTKMPGYGELSGQKLDEKEVGARQEVITDKNKHHPHDFALWFFLVGRFAKHEMNWTTPWGSGFPGWHLECSAIIHETLGDPIDIHTGGVDHIGTHHPNEIAQTSGAFGNKLANYWLHNEFVLVDDKKMAKSKGNFYTLDDVVSRGYDPLALRLLFLQAHYRNQQNFTWKNLDGAQNRLFDFRAFADLKWQLINRPAQSSEDFAQTLKQMEENLGDDLNTPIALRIFNAFTDMSVKQPISKDNASDFERFLIAVDKMFGLSLSDRPDINENQSNMIAEREKARATSSWVEADKIRKELAEQGIETNDTALGTIWSRKT